MDRHNGHLPVKRNIKKSDLECEWNVQKRSSKTTTTTAHESWRARCEDDCFVTHRHKLEPWDTRENLTCVEVLNVRGVGVVFTHPSLTRESLLPVNETPCNWDSFEKKSLCIPTPCLPPSVWWLPPWRRRAWWGCGRIPFPSSFLGRLVQFLQWILRTVDSLFAALVCWDGVWSFLLQTLRTTALWFWWLRRSLHVVPSDRFYLGCGVPIHNCFHVFYVLLRCTRMYDLLLKFRRSVRRMLRSIQSRSVTLCKSDNFEIVPIWSHIPFYLHFLP